MGAMDHPVFDAPSDAAYTLLLPSGQRTPVVFASPHSGQDYPASFIASARLDPLALRRSEDSFVDELFASAPVHGAPLLAARFPRAYCDPNREPWELDPTMFEDALPPWVNTTSPRVGAGLGTIARVVSSGEMIYRRKLPFAEAEQRIRRCWEPYHEALSGLIARTRERFEACLLVDCHSMPGGAARAMQGSNARDVDVVLGDAHGTACSGRITRRAEAVLVEQGFTVRRNEPYAGGYVTRHYGRPRENVHALQIEVARRLYMDEARIVRLPDFEALAGRLGVLVETLCAEAVELLTL
jgi:N-formylglutamate amidohydrolase